MTDRVIDLTDAHQAKIAKTPHEHPPIFGDGDLPPDLRVTIAHDYLSQRGGAERVALALLGAFPGAPLVTSVYDPKATYPEFANHVVHTSWLQHLPAARTDPRRMLPVMHRTWRGLDPLDADLVIASSTGFAHGISSDVPKIVYCHNPPRWLYQPEQYLLGHPRHVRAGLRTLSPHLKRLDQRAAATADLYLANSTSVAERIRNVYGREAHVVFPPVMIDANLPREPIPGIEPGFYLTVSRRRGYKNTTVACDAVEQLPDARIVVVGDLQPRADGRAWSSRVRSTGGVTDAELRWLYANCTALIAASFEDFGLTPIEAAAFGKPTVALRAGGYLDSVIEDVTGVFADEPTAEHFAGAIERLARVPLDAATLRAHSTLFSPERFVTAIRGHAAGLLSGASLHAV